MSADERALYDDVTRYCSSPASRRSGAAQRQLLVIGFHRRMASSHRALGEQPRARGGAAARLLLTGAERRPLVGSSLEDLEDERRARADRHATRAPPPTSRRASRPSSSSSRASSRGARRSSTDSKAQALLDALRVRLEEAATGEGSGKLVIFTESLATQEYLRELLLESGPGRRTTEITLFRGNNDGAARAQAPRRAGRRRSASGSARAVARAATSRVRLALVHEFKHALEGVHLDRGRRQGAEPPVLRHGHQLRPAVEPAAHRAAHRPLPPLRAAARRHRHQLPRRGQRGAAAHVRDPEPEARPVRHGARRLRPRAVRAGARARRSRRRERCRADFDAELRRIYERRAHVAQIEAELRALERLDRRCSAPTARAGPRAHRGAHRVALRRDGAARVSSHRRRAAPSPGRARSRPRAPAVRLSGQRGRGAIGASRPAQAGACASKSRRARGLPEPFREGVRVAVGGSQSLDAGEPLHLGHPLVHAARRGCPSADRGRSFECAWDSGEAQRRGRGAARAARPAAHR